MLLFDWNDEKNEQLERERGVRFEDVLYHLTHDGLLDVIEHSNQTRYPGQRVLIVDIEGYAHLVPFVEEDDVVFMKTIIPSRKLTRRYLGGKKK